MSFSTWLRSLSRVTLSESEVRARMVRAREERAREREEIDDQAVAGSYGRERRGLFLTQKDIERQRDEFVHETDRQL
jgi:hypothetical protein